MKVYVRSAVVNDRSISPNNKKKPSKPRVSQEDIRAIFEQGVDQSKLAGHAIDYYKLGKSPYGSGWIIAFSLRNVTYRFKSVYPDIYFSRLDNLTPGVVARQINSEVDNLYLIPDSTKKQLEDRLAKAKQECAKAIDYCLDKYDCEGDYNYSLSLSEIFGKSILIDIYFTSIAGLPVENKYRDVEYNGKRYFVSGLYLNGNSPKWELDKSYEENLANLETAFKQTINKCKDALGIEMDPEEARTLFEQRCRNSLTGYVRSKQIPIDISNIEISERNGELYLTFDISAYDGKIDMTVEFSKSELARINLWNKLDSMLKYRKRKLGI